MTSLKLNFKDNMATQDMIRLIEKAKGITASEAIESSICAENFKKVMKEGWASIALDLWGHGDPDRKWLSLDNPCVEVNLDDEQFEFISKIKTSEGVGTEEAVAYLLIFTMDALGYHV